MIFIGFQFLKTKRFKLSEEHIKINSSSVIFFRDFFVWKNRRLSSTNGDIIVAVVNCLK